MLLQVPGHRQRVRHVAVHAQAQRLDPLQEQKRVERAQAGAHVAQAFHPRLDDVGDVPEGLRELQAVVRTRRLGELREFALLPGELSAVHDDSTDAGAMPAHELGERVHHDVRTEIDRTAQVRRRERVVDHQRDVVFVCDARHRFDIQHVAPRVADGLPVKALGLGRDGFAEVLRIVRLDELRIEPQLAEAHVELRVRAAVQRAGGYQFVARLHQVAQGDELGGLPARHRQRRDRLATRSSSTPVVGFMMRV